MLANKTAMKFLYYTSFLTCLCAVFCFGESIHGFGFKSKQARIWEAVEKLLQGRGELMISRGTYGRTDYPMCVRSRPLGSSAGKIHHNLSYYERDIKASQTHGHRLYRDAFFELPTTTKRIINVYAYLGTGQVDNKISGWYNVLYANKVCFILATEEQAKYGGRFPSQDIMLQLFHQVIDPHQAPKLYTRAILGRVLKKAFDNILSVA
ncbi:uncharacterized protein [Dermacentor andersoni]|uniref:uncharacterized protein isoform X3 n=1 Tax=Dermacentor andersoni TaxID=34620 RepID=UPI003B3ACC0C